jgi:AcrR family transcriptional regulator
MDDIQTNTKKQLMDAAIEVFHDKGYQKARVSDIVGAAGVAQGTFYIYFKSKEDVFIRVCSELTVSFSKMLENTTDIFSGSSHLEIRANLNRFISRLITLFHDNGKLTRILFREGSSYGGPFTGLYENIHNQFVEIIHRQLEKNRDRSSLSFEDAETIASFLLGLFDRSLFYFMEIKKNVDIPVLSRCMTDFVLFGLTGEKQSREV